MNVRHKLYFSLVYTFIRAVTFSLCLDFFFFSLSLFPSPCFTMMRNMWEQSLSIVNAIGSGAICAGGPQSAKLQIFMILGARSTGGAKRRHSHRMKCM